jgi:hypothetical protein
MIASLNMNRLTFVGTTRIFFTYFVYLDGSSQLPSQVAEFPPLYACKFGQSQGRYYDWIRPVALSGMSKSVVRMRN